MTRRVQLIRLVKAGGYGKHDYQQDIAEDDEAIIGVERQKYRPPNSD